MRAETFPFLHLCSRTMPDLPMITQPLLDAQRAAMTNDSMGLNCLSAERAATSDGAEPAGELAANSDVGSAEAEWPHL